MNANKRALFVAHTRRTKFAASSRAAILVVPNNPMEEETSTIKMLPMRRDCLYSAGSSKSHPSPPWPWPAPRKVVARVAMIDDMEGNRTIVLWGLQGQGFSRSQRRTEIVSVGVSSARLTGSVLAPRFWQSPAHGSASSEHECARCIRRMPSQASNSESTNKNWAVNASTCGVVCPKLVRRIMRDRAPPVRLVFLVALSLSDLPCPPPSRLPNPGSERRKLSPESESPITVF